MVNPKEQETKEAKEGIYCGSCCIFVIISLSTLNFYISFIPGLWFLPFLIPAFIIFLFGIKKITSKREYEAKIREIGLIYGGCFILLLSIFFFIYGDIVNSICRFDYSNFECRSIQNVVFGTLFSLLFISIFSITKGFANMKMLSIVQTQLKSGIVKPTSPQEKPLYIIRKEIVNLESQIFDHICGKCGEKNNFRNTNKELGLFLCLKCGSENYLDD